MQPPVTPTDSVRDPLTGVYVRGLFDAQLAAALAQAGYDSTSCVLCLFDVDHFKDINDTYGHQRGDQILHALTQRIQALIRGTDLLFRYGGDEFTLLLPQTNKDQALIICQRIFDQLRATRFAGEPPLAVSISMGVAEYPADAATAEELLRVADSRNYVAKGRGRNCFVAADSHSAPPLTSAQGRLIEREQAQGAAQAFLQALPQQQRGVFSIAGPVGVGRSRFLGYVGQIAHMLGHAVLSLEASGNTQYQSYKALRLARWPVPLPFSNFAAFIDGLRKGLEQQHKTGLLIAVANLPLLDQATTRLLQELFAAPGFGPLALAYTTTSPHELSPFANLVTFERQVVLAPFSEQGMKIWLRGLLQSEPAPALVRWLYQQSHGLPARAEEIVRRLLERGPLPTEEWQLPSGAAQPPDPALERDLAYDLPHEELSAVPAPASPTNLPASLTSFVGREIECWQLNQLFDSCQLVTLTGPGGIGKTRLALEAATLRKDQYPDGTWFVPLDAIRTPELLIPTIAQTLGVQEVRGQTPSETLSQHLANKALLLVLDNFEHILGAAASLHAIVLAAAPRVHVLVTSRELLCLPGEQVFHVPPLSIPDQRAALRPAALEQYSAIALFVHRAKSVQYDFALDDANAACIASICQRLEGIPLALELAAVHCDELTPEELFSQLDHQLVALGQGPRDLAPRQRTLRGAIEWSYGLLSPADQAFLARLSIFTGGWTLDAATAICGDPGEPHDAILAKSASLCNKSLVYQHEQKAGLGRYHMLEMIREYARERLERAEEAPAVRERAIAYYLALVEQAEPHLTGPRQQSTLELLEDDHGNLRASLEQLILRRDAERALRFCAAFWKFWQFRAYHSEGRRSIDRSLALADALAARVSLPPALLTMQAKALWGNGWLAHGQGEYEAVADSFARSLAISEELGDQRGIGLALQGLGSLALHQGDHQYAQSCFERSRAIFVALGDREETAWATTHLGQALRHAGDMSGAEACHRLGLALFEELGHEWGRDSSLYHLAETLVDQADVVGAKAVLEPWLIRKRETGHYKGTVVVLALIVQGDAELYAGNLDAAEHAFQESLSISRAAPYYREIAHAMDGLGRVAIRRGAYQAAQQHFAESLQLLQQLKELRQIAQTLEGIAALAGLLRNYPNAALLYGAAEAIREKNHLPLVPHQRAALDQELAVLSAGLGPDAFAATWQAGQTLSLEQALSIARAVLLT